MQLPETSYENHPVTSLSGLITKLNAFIRDNAYVMIPVLVLLVIFSGGVLARELVLGPVRTVTVVGTGIKTVKPEGAAVSFSMVYTGMTQQDSVSEGERRFNAILAAVGQFKPAIDKSTYQVVGNGGTTTIASRSAITGGYQYVNAAKVTVTDPGSIQSVVKALYDAGATVVGQIEYIPKDQAKVDAEVRDLALKDARDQAWAMARSSGLTLGKPVIIQDGVASQTSAGVTSTTGTTGSNTITASGDVQASAILTVTFEMR